MNNEEVEAHWSSEFGRNLFNAYSQHRYGPRLLFSKRVRVVKAMLAAMLEQEAQEKPFPRSGE